MHERCQRKWNSRQNNRYWVLGGIWKNILFLLISKIAIWGWRTPQLPRSENAPNQNQNRENCGYNKTQDSCGVTCLAIFKKGWQYNLPCRLHQVRKNVKKKSAKRFAFLIKPRTRVGASARNLSMGTSTSMGMSNYEYCKMCEYEYEYISLSTSASYPKY